MQNLSLKGEESNFQNTLLRRSSGRSHYLVEEVAVGRSMQFPSAPPSPRGLRSVECKFTRKENLHSALVSRGLKRDSPPDRGPIARRAAHCTVDPLECIFIPAAANEDMGNGRRSDNSHSLRGREEALE